MWFLLFSRDDFHFGFVLRNTYCRQKTLCMSSKYSISFKIDLKYKQSYKESNVWGCKTKLCSEYWHLIFSNVYLKHSCSFFFFFSSKSRIYITCPLANTSIAKGQPSEPCHSSFSSISWVQNVPQSFKPFLLKNCPFHPLVKEGRPYKKKKS